ncbi:RNA ligase family protein [Bacteroides acidifaciens]|uniref:RNA ligase family protein n=1 Tax=Bacteroides acidifaciens TaxID=85831 RepID=UPI00248AFBAC|nr:RNA ligase family protein [Bacteroides acidifaciens]
MVTYHKIDAVFERDMTGNKKLIPGKFRSETVEFLANNTWIFTEKIDGTNIRVHWDGHQVEFGGRTDKAQIPPKLSEYLESVFKDNTAEELFEQKFGEADVILFGEGYGPGIQKGGLYRDDVSFILFDVLIGDVYLKWDDVKDIAKTFGIDVVPVLGYGTINDAVEIVKSKPMSLIGIAPMEGIVARPVIGMFDRLGRRVITKIKVRDFT